MSNRQGCLIFLIVAAIVFLLFFGVFPLIIMWGGNVLLEAIGWEFRFEYFTALAASLVMMLIGGFFK